jgi:hypothetical protein
VCVFNPNSAVLARYVAGDRYMDVAIYAWPNHVHHLTV